jgi:hypothetical protein
MILFVNDKLNVSVNLQGQLYVEITVPVGTAVPYTGASLTQQESKELLLSLEKAKQYVFSESSD